MAGVGARVHSVVARGQNNREKRLKGFETQVTQYLADAGDKADETFQDNVGLIAVVVAIMGYVVAKKL